MLICLGFCVSVSAASEAGFQGAGTKDDPYQIGSYEDLCRFRDNVNNGKEYENVYFSQTADIDLQKKEWTPIGVGGCRFMGTYDGGGHSIENLVIQNKKKDIAYGFFSSLGGCVANIKLANGDIKGDLSGGIAGTAVGDKACIINCYSNVHVKGMRSGGIAGNFRDGYIVGCINTGEIQGKESCSIVGSSSSVKVYASYSTGKKKLMQNFCIAYRGIMSHHELYATGTTGRMIEEVTNLTVHKFLAGHTGGEQQLGAMIESNDLDMMIFLRDPQTKKSHDVDINNIFSLCDIHNIPLATNLATAELLIKALDRGDLDWRELFKH